MRPYLFSRKFAANCQNSETSCSPYLCNPPDNPRNYSSSYFRLYQIKYTATATLVLVSVKKTAAQRHN